MTGFTLSNMDYHPVKFMIQCFEANYPESLGVVLIHNAPWIFQGLFLLFYLNLNGSLLFVGVWKIIRGWLDPVVAAKVHFTNNRAGLEEFIQPEHIIKDLEGDENWKYEFKEPIEGENALMKDIDSRDRLLRQREDLYAQFEANTRRWISHSGEADIQAIKAEREELAAQLRKGYWQLDPYVRARSTYDREGVIGPLGNVNWYPHKAAVTSGNNTTPDDVD